MKDIKKYNRMPTWWLLLHNLIVNPDICVRFIIAQIINYWERTINTCQLITIPSPFKNNYKVVYKPVETRSESLLNVYF